MSEGEAAAAPVQRRREGDGDRRRLCPRLHPEAPLLRVPAIHEQHEHTWQSNTRNCQHERQLASASASARSDGSDVESGPSLRLGSRSLATARARDLFATVWYLRTAFPPAAARREAPRHAAAARPSPTPTRRNNNPQRQSAPIFIGVIGAAAECGPARPWKARDVGSLRAPRRCTTRPWCPSAAVQRSRDDP